MAPVLPANPEADVDRDRFARLIADAVREVADQADVPESELKNVLFRLFQSALLQERRAPAARLDLARVLSSSILDLDPVPYATIEQARRLASLRAELLRSGAVSTAAIAEVRGMTMNNARQWISRHRRADRLFTVTHEGEALVPAFLLDEEFEPRGEAVDAIHALREAGEDGWALWAWFAQPSPWTAGRPPVELLATDAALVKETARQRAASRS